MPSIFVVTKRPSESESLVNHGVAVFPHIASISLMGEKSGIKRLDEYFYIPSEEIADLLPPGFPTVDEIEATNPILWFQAKEGLELVKNYSSLLEDNPSPSENTQKEILSELGCFEKIFQILEDENNDWHFEYDI